MSSTWPGPEVLSGSPSVMRRRFVLGLSCSITTSRTCCLLGSEMALCRPLPSAPACTMLAIRTGQGGLLCALGLQRGLGLEW